MPIGAGLPRPFRMHILWPQLVAGAAHGAPGFSFAPWVSVLIWSMGFYTSVSSFWKATVCWSLWVQPGSCSGCCLCKLFRAPVKGAAFVQCASAVCLSALESSDCGPLCLANS